MKTLSIILGNLLLIVGLGTVAAQDDADLDMPWDGLSPETALLVGDAVTILDGQGELEIKWFVRNVVDVELDFIAPIIDPQFNEGESAAEVEPPFLPKAEKDFEWVLIWVEFTCMAERCEPLEDLMFYLAGELGDPYENVVDVDGKPLDGLLAGELAGGESAVGWLVFEVDYYDCAEGSLILWDDGDDPHYFLIDHFPPGAILIVVTARGTTPLYDCPAEDCEQIERAMSGEHFLLLDNEGDWFLVRNAFGKIGYLSVRQAGTP
jgi:hypothetical protein